MSFPTFPPPLSPAPTLCSLSLSGTVVGRPGSHWEQRLMNGDLMAPMVTSSTLTVSSLTLALLEDRYCEHHTPFPPPPSALRCSGE